MRGKSFLNAKGMSSIAILTFVSLIFGAFYQAAAQMPGQLAVTRLPNGTEMRFVYIPEGTFIMGSAFGNEKSKPEHRVFVSSFWMLQTEVTQRQWKAVMGGLPRTLCTVAGREQVLGNGTDPIDFSPLGDDKPIMCVDWNDTQQFMQKLNS
ncbi:MAG: SUMF1/EgtB/PvdO family nonheme iron enzyme, partial [Acidobacteria bacterium]|nr:SUMF1/EgtB/PvdO family nonheme iron enzyme [Acidobacteriota bacterium]